MLCAVVVGTGADGRDELGSCRHIYQSKIGKEEVKEIEKYQKCC